VKEQSLMFTFSQSWAAASYCSVSDSIALF